MIFVGDTLEKTAGKVRYLLIISSEAWQEIFCLYGQEWIVQSTPVSAGASGAIFAVIGALIWIVLRNKGKLEGYSSQRLILMAGLSVVNGLTETGIDNWAHTEDWQAVFYWRFCCTGRRLERCKKSRKFEAWAFRHYFLGASAGGYRNSYKYLDRKYMYQA